MHKLTLGVLFFFNTLFVQAQALLSFNVQVVKGNVRLEFVIRGGFTCQGIRVERATDSINFKSIYEFSGVCGGASSDIKYFYTDNSPISNKTNYYRLDLRAYGLSDVVSVFYVDLGDKNYLLIPNPCAGNCKLFFDNEEKRKLQFFVLDVNGKATTEIFTNENSVDIWKLHLANGVYFFTLSDEKKILSKGKFVVE